MRVETALQVFIDEVNGDYYAGYSVLGGEEVHVLTEADLVELPFSPQELRQNNIRIWG